MSRCYPYPPPGYASSAPFSESIKLQNERDRAKKARKKEKKSDKKDKKDRSREEKGQLEDKKHDHRKRHRNERSLLDKKSTCYPSTREDEVEQLEKSSLTEDHGPPSIQQTCDSPDSLQKSNKRRKHDNSDISRNNHGSVLRIRLPLAKQKEAEPPIPGKQTFTKPKRPLIPLEQPLVKQKEPECPVREQQCISKVVDQPTPLEKPCFSGRTEATPAQECFGAAGFDLGTFEKYNGTSSSRKKEKKFQKLILNWTPRPIPMEKLEDDDQDWLFGGPQRLQDNVRKRSHEESEPSLGQQINLCSWPPRACHLKEADLYALPYVFPF